MLPSQLDLGFESCRVGVVGLQRRPQSIVSSGVEIAAALARAINGVTKRLRRLIGKLPRAERLETCLPVVECILRRLAGSIQLLFQSIE